MPVASSAQQGAKMALAPAEGSLFPRLFRKAKKASAWRDGYEMLLFGD